MLAERRTPTYEYCTSCCTSARTYSQSVMTTSDVAETTFLVEQVEEGFEIVTVIERDVIGNPFELIPELVREDSSEKVGEGSVQGQRRKRRKKRKTKKRLM